MLAHYILAIEPVGDVIITLWPSQWSHCDHIVMHETTAHDLLSSYLQFTFSVLTLYIFDKLYNAFKVQDMPHQSML